MLITFPSFSKFQTCVAYTPVFVCLALTIFAKWNWVLLTPLGQDRKKGQPVGTEQWCTFNGIGFAMGGIKIRIA
jgi:hypothetical protein